MKRIVLVVMLAMAASMSMSAQNEVKHFSLKPIVGLAATTFYGEDAQGSRLRWGFAGGVEVEYQATQKFSVSAIPIYGMGGAMLEDGNLVWKNDKIMIPVMANYYVAPGFKLSLGLQPGFVVKSSLYVKVNGNGVDYDASGVTRTFDFAIPLGVCYEFANGLSVGMLWHMGLTKVMDKEMTIGGVYVGKGNFRNTGGVLTLGYKFKL